MTIHECIKRAMTYDNRSDVNSIVSINIECGRLCTNSVQYATYQMDFHYNNITPEMVDSIVNGTVYHDIPTCAAQAEDYKSVEKFYIYSFNTSKEKEEAKKILFRHIMDYLDVQTQIYNESKNVMKKLI